MKATLERLTNLLLSEIGPDGYWPGELSSSALSTAVATIALGAVDPIHHRTAIDGGLRWLSAHANGDGGWGDTVRSKSNISTTALCWAAFGAANADVAYRKTVTNAEGWLTRAAGSLQQLPDAITERYGKDRTFSVPILLTLALSGRLGPNGWQQVLALPFELAVVPRKFYGALKLPVVSYALPALIAIGQAVHHHAPSANPVLRGLRNAARAKTLRLLSELQPSNGGFLEATPLTAFVTMSLASADQSRHSVAVKGARFLSESQRTDGSWPIDTNLATWVTTLSIKALSSGEMPFNNQQKSRLHDWLITQQTRTVHPYTGAAAGAWAWTDLPGGVPDADDTAGALLALSILQPSNERTLQSAEAGITWLLDLQNRDGGIPTFCVGWGTLPFDRSTPEITAHALRAWAAWRPRINRTLGTRIDRATRKAFRYLERVQRPDGSFIPLWFGNEHTREEENPVYGTAQVLVALSEMKAPLLEVERRAADYLVAAQLPTGGWGGSATSPESIEETAVAVEGLATYPNHAKALTLGANRLVQLLDSGDGLSPAPIGLYFARLWYYEKLYPAIFAAGALGKVIARSNRLVSPAAANAF